MPTEVVEVFLKFTEGRGTGNVTLNIKDGRILGIHVEQIISLKLAGEPDIINGAKRRPECPSQI